MLNSLDNPYFRDETTHFGSPSRGLPATHFRRQYQESPRLPNTCLNEKSYFDETDLSAYFSYLDVNYQICDNYVNHFPVVGNGFFSHPCQGAEQINQDSSVFNLLYNHNFDGLRSNQNGLSPVPRNQWMSSLSLERNQWLQDSFDCSSLRDSRGNIVALAKDQDGCRYLQRTMNSLPKEEIEMIFKEVIDRVCELMIDPFGNYVVQKLVELCSEEQRTHILLMLTNDDFQLVRICLNSHGTRAVLKLLENLTNPRQISLAVAALSPGAVALTKDTNGHYVIQYCVKHFSHEDTKYLLNEVADNCYGIATDKSGCCVLQHCVEYSKGAQRERLVAEIIANALLLAEDRYGNYVVQHLLALRVPPITASLLRQLEGHYVSFSCNKYGSNVVERCLLESGEEQSTRIIIELLRSPNVSMLLMHPFGNYVIQSALLVSQGLVHDALRYLIRINSPMMRSNIYGKKVLAWFQKRRLPYI